MVERQKTFRATVKTFSVRSVNVNVYKVFYEIIVGIKMGESTSRMLLKRCVNEVCVV